METFDIVIVGAGPAGLTAGLYAGRQKSKALILDKGLTGGLGLEVPLMENYPGFESISGLDLIVKMKAQTERFCEIREHIMIKSIKKEDEGFLLEIKSINSLEETFETIFSKSIVLATGASHRKLNVPGEEEFLGRGISYCATCDGMFFADRDVLMIGGGNTAVQEAIFLNNLGANVKLVHSGRKLRCDNHLKEIIDEKGNVLTSDIFETVIKTKKRLTYSKCNELLETGKVDSDKEYDDKVIEAPEITYADIFKDFINIANKVVKDNMFPIPPLFRTIQEQSGTDWAEMYKVFNMGHRFEFYVPQQYADSIISISKSFNIDARIVGHVEASDKSSLTIKSEKGVFNY